MNKNRNNRHSRNVIRVVSVFEALKGLMVLFTGFGLILVIHKDLHSIAEQFVRHLHMNPARHYPNIFIDAMNHLTDLELWVLALSALIYSIVRLVEAYGLWFQRQWAEWFGFLTGGMYIPIEIYELLRGATWIILTIFIVNLIVVTLLGNSLYKSRH